MRHGGYKVLRYYQEGFKNREDGIKNDRLDYPFGRAPWALVIEAEPLNTVINISGHRLKVKKKRQGIRISSR